MSVDFVLENCLFNGMLVDIDTSRPKNSIVVGTSSGIYEISGSSYNISPVDEAIPGIRQIVTGPSNRLAVLLTNRIWILDVRRQRRIHLIEEKSAIQSLAFCGKSPSLVYSTKGRIVTLDLRSTQERELINDPETHHWIVAGYPTRDLVVAASDNREIMTLNLRTNRVEARVDAGEDVIHKICLEPSCKVFYAGCEDGSVRSWRLNWRNKWQRSKFKQLFADPISGLTLNPEQQLLAAGSAQGTLTVMKTGSMELIGGFPGYAGNAGISFQDTHMVYIKSGAIEIVDPVSRRRKHRMPWSAPGNLGADLDLDRQVVAISNGGAGVEVMDYFHGKRLFQSGMNGLSAPTLSKDGRFVAFISDDNDLCLGSLTDGTLMDARPALWNRTYLTENLQDDPLRIARGITVDQGWIPVYNSNRCVLYDMKNRCKPFLFRPDQSAVILDICVEKDQVFLLGIIPSTDQSRFFVRDLAADRKKDLYSGTIDDGIRFGRMAVHEDRIYMSSWTRLYELMIPGKKVVRQYPLSEGRCRALLSVPDKNLIFVNGSRRSGWLRVIPTSLQEGFIVHAHVGDIQCMAIDKNASHTATVGDGIIKIWRLKS